MDGQSTGPLEAQVVRSLDGEDTGLYRYLPYLLQDIWELGSSPEVIIQMARDHAGGRINVLDLCCGKGAVSVRLAHATGCRVKGIDAMEAFIDVARLMADGYGVSGLCSFEVGDIRKSVGKEAGYDLVIMGAAGDVLGGMDATVARLKKVVGNNGLILIDDAFCEDGTARDGYRTRREIMEIFARNGVELIREAIIGRDWQKACNAANNDSIARRAAELKKSFPDKGTMFDDYVKRQLAECDILENEVTCVAWLLRKIG